MIKKEDLVKKIQDAGGSYTSDSGIVFTVESDGDGTIHAKRNKHGAFLMTHSKEDMGKFYISGSEDMKTFSNLLEFVKDLANDVEYELMMPGAEKIVTERKVKDVEIEKENGRLSGKVEAYEKILIGRTITANA